MTEPLDVGAVRARADAAHEHGGAWLERIRRSAADVPALCDEVERLRAENEALTEANLEGFVWVSKHPEHRRLTAEREEARGALARVTEGLDGCDCAESPDRPTWDDCPVHGSLGYVTGHADALGKVCDRIRAAITGEG